MGRNRQPRRQNKTADNSSPLKALAENSCLKEYFHSGSGAIREKECISVPQPRLTGGSVNLDKAMEQDLPEDNRWDYALEYDGCSFFLEVHPASTSEVECVIRKVRQVKEWLAAHVPDFLQLPKKEKGERCFYWISSGKSDIRLLPQSRQAKQLASAHIKPVGRVWDYRKLFDRQHDA